MTKTKSFTVAALLLVFVSVFGAWTGGYGAETRYADADLFSVYANETISYTRKELTEKYTPGNCPAYTGLSDLSNACGAIAGAQLIAYYDKYFEDLIPGWTSYYTASGKYRKQDDVYVPALTRELYTLMRTNVDDVGVSRADFINGLTAYVNGKGRLISYDSVKSGGTLDYEKCKNAIDNNKVIVLLTTPTSVYGVGQGTNSDTIVSTNINGAHIMVAFGYLQIKYYNVRGLFRTDTYLCVSTGKDSVAIAYYKINSNTTEAAYIVNIQ